MVFNKNILFVFIFKKYGCKYNGKITNDINNNRLL